MPTNIINLTNFITNTILETNIITNTNFITETNSTTSWSDPILLVTMIGSVFTALSAFLMYRSVQEMKRQVDIQYNQDMINKINIFTKEFMDNLTHTDEWKELEQFPCVANVYNYICRITTNLFYSKARWELNSIKYVMKKNQNSQQIKYLEKMISCIESYEDVINNFVYTQKNKNNVYCVLFDKLTNEQQQKFQQLELHNILTRTVNNYHEIWQMIRAVSIEEYADIDQSIDNINSHKERLKSSIEQR